jgi:hypothetical protein
MIMIDGKVTTWSAFPATDGTSSVLPGEQRRVFVSGDAASACEVVRTLGRLASPAPRPTR